jgi:hypothetical protein
VRDKDKIVDKGKMDKKYVVWRRPGAQGRSLGFSLGMFRDHDFVVSLTRMTAVLVNASLRLVERLVAAESAARPTPNKRSTSSR